MINESKKIWNALLGEIQNKVSTVAFDIWFSRLEPLTVSFNKLVLIAPLKDTKSTLEHEYRDTFLWAIGQINTNITDVILILPEDKSAYLDSVQKESEPVSVSADDNRNAFPFDPKFTFDNFVVGSSNQIAYAAAKAVAGNPGEHFNPLFIYGGVGLGKTHMMHAIGNEILKNNPKSKILYVTTEQFVNEFIDSILNNKNNEQNRRFREHYRSVDVLMMDDVQFIANKTTSQEELFHTFNNLYQSKKQIVLSSDRHPKELTFLEDRLQSRFQCGLTCDITPPDLETRIAILQQKALEKKFNVSNHVLYFIAEKIDSNIRELEGALSKVIFYCSLMGKEADSLELVKQALKDDIDVSNHILSIDTIVDAVCDYYSISKKDIIGKGRTKQVALARQIAVYLIFDMLALPLATIGNYFGGKDHTTIMYAKNKIIEMEKEEPVIAAQLKDIRNLINKK